jgi:hypothetical protein
MQIMLLNDGGGHNGVTKNVTFPVEVSGCKVGAYFRVGIDELKRVGFNNFWSGCELLLFIDCTEAVEIKSCE